MADDKNFLPPHYEDITSDSEPLSEPVVPEEEAYDPDADSSPFHFESLEDGDGSPRLKLDVADIARFSSSDFVEEGTLLTDVEEYSSRIRVEADKQARLINHTADMALSLAEEELANAEVIKVNAEAEAKRIVEEAQAEVFEIKRAASEKGFSEGFTTGFEQAKAENERVSLKVLDIVAEMKDLRLSLYREHEGELVKQILLIAKKVVHSELTTRPEFVLNLLKGALHHVDDQGRVRINVHPEEYDFIIKHQPELAGFIDEEQVISIKKDVNVSPSGPMIETDFSVVELSMERQFSEIDERLRHCIIERRSLFDPHYKTDLEASKAQTPAQGSDETTTS